MSVLVTEISRHICYLLNIRGKFCFSLPEDSTVKDYFCIFMIVPCQKGNSAGSRHETAPLKG